MKSYLQENREENSKILSQYDEEEEKVFYMTKKNSLLGKPLKSLKSSKFFFDSWSIKKWKQIFSITNKME